MIRYLNLILFVGMVVMNYLANALPLNNNTTGALSDSYPNLFVPAGITFSIWGVIYLLLAIFSVVQFSPRTREVAISIGWIFALSCIFNALWIVAWHYERLWISLFLMIGLLISLILINSITGKGSSMIVKATFGIYLGWVCIATIANVTALLVSMGWSGGFLPEEVWTIIMIVVGAAIIAFSVKGFSNPWIGVAAVWAFTGIVIKQSGSYLTITVAALVALLAVAAVTIIRFVKG